MSYLDIFGIQFHTFGMAFQITTETQLHPRLTNGFGLPAKTYRLRMIGRCPLSITIAGRLGNGDGRSPTGDFVIAADDSDAKAVRGSDGRKYPWGNDWDTTRANFLDASCPGDTIMLGDKTLDEHMAQFGGRDMVNSDGFAYISPVGSFPAVTSPYGALDMAGNVFNWCEDWWDAKGFPRSTQGDFSPPQGGSWRVVSGSSWGNPGRRAVGLPCGTRTRLRPAMSTSSFRVLLRSSTTKGSE
jgi:hypothetical protein